MSGDRATKDAGAGACADRELALRPSFGDKAGMPIRLALTLSAIALAICLTALAGDLAIYLLHIKVAPKLKQALDIVSFIWPLALVFFGTYMRKAQSLKPSDRA
jgi:hypothetical protein